ncbi:vitrin-like [Ciona intestinalis]
MGANLFMIFWVLAISGFSSGQVLNCVDTQADSFCAAKQTAGFCSLQYYQDQYCSKTCNPRCATARGDPPPLTSSNVTNLINDVIKSSFGNVTTFKSSIMASILAIQNLVDQIKLQLQPVVRVDCVTQDKNIWAGKYLALCPANCNNLTIASLKLWGFIVYTGDSRICQAAIHSGTLNATGGLVKIEKTTGVQKYFGNTRNGLTSLSSTFYPSSFQVKPAV